MYGHDFEYDLKLTYHIAKGDEKEGDCKLKWLERTDALPPAYEDAGVKENEFTDIGEVVGKKFPKLLTEGTLRGWTKRTKACPPAPGGQTIKLFDRPLARSGTSRTMDFKIIAESADDCNCDLKSITVRATQALGPDEKGILKKTFTTGEVEKEKPK